MGRNYGVTGIRMLPRSRAIPSRPKSWSAGKSLPPEIRSRALPRPCERRPPSLHMPRLQELSAVTTALVFLKLHLNFQRRPPTLRRTLAPQPPIQLALTNTYEPQPTECHNTTARRRRTSTVHPRRTSSSTRLRHIHLAFQAMEHPRKLATVTAYQQGP